MIEQKSNIYHQEEMLSAVCINPVKYHDVKGKYLKTPTKTLLNEEKGLFPDQDRSKGFR